MECLIDDFEFYEPIGNLTATLPTARLLSSIESAAPNPFNPSTTIQFTVGRSGPTRLFIVDVRGRRVRELRNELLDAGVYSAKWDGRDDRGASVASGMYVAILRAAEGGGAQKLVLTK